MSLNILLLIFEKEEIFIKGKKNKMKEALKNFV